MSYYDDEFVDELTDGRDRLASENKKLRNYVDGFHRERIDHIERYFTSLREWGRRKKELLGELQHLREQGRQVETELVEAKRRTLLLLATLTLAFEEVESNAEMFEQLGYPMLHKSTLMVANKLRSLIDAAGEVGGDQIVEYL